jgi:hypothetical protein
MPNISHILVVALSLTTSGVVRAEDRQAYFGALHVHTGYSFDAFQFGTRTNPDDAYRFALGSVIEHPTGEDIQLDRALDFYAVTDHAAYLGFLRSLADPANPLSQDPLARRIVDASTVKSRGGYLPDAAEFAAQNDSRGVNRSAWQDIVAAAERHYEPGKFTTFIGYEYTASRDGGNLHRNVIFRGNDVPTDIFGRLDSANPEDLWGWMDQVRKEGADVLAIPHNANGSDGWMFQTEQFDGTPIDKAYADKRLRNEPIVEITQVKGTSETHPFLSPDDEWADFEIFPFKVGRWEKSRPRGSYVREALGNGLLMQNESGFNPYKLGFVGASDTHNSGFVFSEKDYTGKVGVHDYYPKSRGSVPIDTYDGTPTYREVFRRYYSASGLTGVWADDNTRAAIFDAFRRKETFATSGPRIRVRLFAGHELPANLHTRANAIAVGYERGVPQGGDLPRATRSPTFLAMAQRDQNGAPLQRLQIIKGWIEDGRKRERVFDVACSDGLVVDPLTHRCPDNGARVDLRTCAVSTNVGASELATTWVDPEFDVREAAFYYVRVLENPVCRWSTWDAVTAGTTPRVSIPATIQERAWTSPIWYNP